MREFYMKNRECIIRFRERQLEQMEAMLVDCKLADLRELIGCSMALLDWTIRETKAGKRIGSLENGTMFNELKFKPLQSLH